MYCVCCVCVWFLLNEIAWECLVVLFMFCVCACCVRASCVFCVCVALFTRFGLEFVLLSMICVRCCCLFGRWYVCC